MCCGGKCKEGIYISVASPRVWARVDMAIGNTFSVAIAWTSRVAE